MTANPPFRTIQLQRDTAANWTSANTLLAEGEMGIEMDTRKAKIGDGVTQWNSLQYAFPSAGDMDKATYDPANIAQQVVGTTATQTFSTGVKTFLDGKMGLRNIADTFTSFFTNTNTASRTYTLPDVSDTLVGRATIDIFTGVKTFSTGMSFPAPRGFLINGKLDVTVNAGSLTFATKTLSGGNPSASDPIFVRIGDTVRAITSPLTKTLASGNNFFGLGNSGFATIEQDLFVYLMWDGTNIRILCSRIPSAQLQTDFDTSGSPWLNEKGYDGSGSGIGANTVENIGRFAATLSAGAGYTWSIPAFTSANLIQRPIYETRYLTYAPTIAYNGTAPSGTETKRHRYKFVGDSCILSVHQEWTVAGVGNSTVTCTLPISENTIYLTDGLNGGLNIGTGAGYGASNGSTVQCRGGTTRTIGTSINANIFVISGTYQI